MTTGMMVLLRAYGGEVIERRVVDETATHLYITTDEEYRAARRERRDPVMVGFWKGYIVAPDSEEAHTRRWS